MNLYVEEILAWAKRHSFLHAYADENAVNDFAEKYALSEFILPAWRISHIYPDDDRLFLDHVFWANVVNFCYANLEPPFHKYTIYVQGTEKKIESGALALDNRFTELLGESASPIELMKSITKSIGTTKAFLNRDALYDIPLVFERYVNLCEAIEVVEKKFRGEAIHVFEEASWDAWRLIQVLIEHFPVAFGYDYCIDSESYMRLTFAKRAQLLPLIYVGRAADSKILRQLTSIEAIGPIADYQVPKALEHSELIHYSASLRSMIDNKIVLPQSSIEEVEIRVCTIAVVVTVLRKINEMRKQKNLSEVHMGHIDYLFWSLGRELKANHHLTPTSAY